MLGINILNNYQFSFADKVVFPRNNMQQVCISVSHFTLTSIIYSVKIFEDDLDI